MDCFCAFVLFIILSLHSAIFYLKVTNLEHLVRYDSKQIMVRLFVYKNDGTVKYLTDTTITNLYNKNLHIHYYKNIKFLF